MAVSWCTNTGSALAAADGAALILAYDLDRGTADIAAVLAAPPFDEEVRRAIRVTAEALELPEGWLNDSAKGFADVLRPDYRQRRIQVGVFGRVSVYALGRGDLILLKLFALRAQDVMDLRQLKPTAQELDFVRANLARIATIRPDRAMAIELYLEQGGR